MEIVIVLAVILVYVLILDVSVNYIVLAGAVLLYLFSAILTLSFFICNIFLLFSKRKKAQFLRIDNFKSSRYKVAYYLVEGKEYPCIFPKEGFMENRLYRQEKAYYVMLNKRLKKVYDRYAVTTCILGFLAGLVLNVGLAFFVLGI